MTEITKEYRPHIHITKIIVSRTKDSTEYIEGRILGEAEVIKIISGRTGKGRLPTVRYEIKGKLHVELDKNNFDILERISWETFNSCVLEGNKSEHIFKLLEENNGKYIVEI